MSDVFISYKRGPDEERVEVLVGALRANGLSVWWDRDIPPNAPWEETIQQEISSAKIVLVCWSENAVASENVRSEARWAKERNKLLQVFVQKCEPPLFFGEHQGLMLLDNADVYGPKFIAVRDAARALIARVDAAGGDRLEADLTPEERKQRDKLARQFTRDEPAAPWEASQYAFTLAIASLLAGGVVMWQLPEHGFPSTVEGWLASGVFGAIIPLAAFIGGLVAYGWLARRPRRVGIFTGILLSFIAALLATIVTVLLTGVGIQVFVQILQRESSFENELKLLNASTDFIFLRLLIGGLIAFFPFVCVWTLLFLAFLRRAPLRVGPVRALVVVLAIALPLAALASGFLFSMGYAAYQRVEARVDVLIRMKGLAPAEGAVTFPNKLPIEVIKAAQTKVGLPADGQRSEALIDALKTLPNKRDWVLATDGSGDATTLAEIIARSAGPVVIHLKPGTYSFADTTPRDANGQPTRASPFPFKPPLISDPDLRAVLDIQLSAGVSGDLLQQAYLQHLAQCIEIRSALDYYAPACSLIVTGDKPELVTIETDGGIDLDRGMVLANVTLHATQQPGQEARINIDNGAALIGVVATGANWLIEGVSMTPKTLKSWPHRKPYAESGETPEQMAIYEMVPQDSATGVIARNTISGGILLRQFNSGIVNAEFDVIENRFLPIDGFPPPPGGFVSCISVQDDLVARIVGNDLSACGPNPVVFGDKTNVRMRDNKGARDR